jgi:hypothetical protein
MTGDAWHDTVLGSDPMSRINLNLGVDHNHVSLFHADSFSEGSRTMLHVSICRTDESFSSSIHQVEIGLLFYR